MKKSKILISVTIIFLLTIACISSIPRFRVSLFVHGYHKLIEEGLSAGNGVPADDAVLLGYKAVNS